MRKAPPAGRASPRTSGPRFGTARVRNVSMLPTLEPDDLLLVDYRGTLAPGRVVVARFPDGTLVVKRAAYAVTARDGAPAWWLLSDDPGAGVDSRHRGAVPERDVLGVVRVRLWPRPGRVAAGPSAAPDA